MGRPGGSSPALAAVVMLAVAAAWGSMFPVAKRLVVDLPPDDYVAWRALVASLALFALRPGHVLRLDRRLVATGVLLGVVYGVCQVLQFEGLARASVATTAFVLSLFVVFVPVITMVLVRRLPEVSTLLSVVLAAGGIAFMMGSTPRSSTVLLVLLASIGYSVHIVMLGLWARPGDAYALTFVQMVAMASVGLVYASGDGVVMPGAALTWVSLLYLGVVTGAVAMLAQVWAQARLSATQTSVLLVTEPVWATGFAVAFFGAHLDLRTMAGACLILSATVVVLLRPRPPRRNRADGPQQGLVAPPACVQRTEVDPDRRT